MPFIIKYKTSQDNKTSWHKLATLTSESVADDIFNDLYNGTPEAQRSDIEDIAYRTGREFQQFRFVDGRKEWVGTIRLIKQ